MTLISSKYVVVKELCSTTSQSLALTLNAHIITHPNERCQQFFQNFFNFFYFFLKRGYRLSVCSQKFFFLTHFFSKKSIKFGLKNDKTIPCSTCFVAYSTTSPHFYFYLQNSCFPNITHHSTTSSHTYIPTHIFQISNAPLFQIKNAK